MAKISVLETGIVYRGAEPVTPTSNAYMPTVVQLADGQLVVAMNLGTSVGCRHMRPYCCRSTDNGSTWTAPAKVFEPDESAHPVQATVRISKTPAGKLIGFTTLLDRSRPGPSRTNPETGGTVEVDHAVVRSDDGGLTWSAPQVFESPLNWRCYGEPSPFVAVTDDRWLLPSLSRLDWDGNCPLGLKAFVLTSNDAGRTWPKAVDVFDHWSDGIICWEQKQIVLPDGRIFAVTWAFNSRTKKNLPNRYAISDDQGETYTPSLESPVQGQTCTPLVLDDNHILCVYRRTDKNGLWAHIARIDGTKWLPVTDAPIWGTDVQAMGGLDSRMKNLRALKFGYPMLTRLTDGNIFVVFWCTENNLTNIRYFRLSVKN